jgi:hypothetical protein
MYARAFAALLLLTRTAYAAEAPFVCGASAENDARQEALARWAAERPGNKTANAVPSAAVRGGMVVLGADDLTAPFRRPIDLTGKTLSFIRNGPAGFIQITSGLVFDDDRGDLLTVDAAHNARFMIQGFQFPFFERSLRALTISQLHGIYFDGTPPAAARTTTQWNDAEVVAPETAVIAPLLTTELGAALAYPNIYAREQSDRVTITWANAQNGEAIQAVLQKNGDIRFAYRSIGENRSGALLITSGRETWRTPAEVGAVNDFLFDVPQSPFSGMLDITAAAISRVGNTNLLQFAFALRDPIDRARLGGETVSFSVRIGRFSSAPRATLKVTNDPAMDTFSVGAWETQGSPAAVVLGDTVTFTVAQEMLLTKASTEDDVSFSSSYAGGGDLAVVHAVIAAASGGVRTDFGMATAARTLTGPILETFTLPVLNLGGVFQRVQEAFAVDPTQIDAVAVYQTFPTDIVYYAGAYSTGGNPGVDNIEISGVRSRSSQPRTPALLHMNTIRYGHNAMDKGAAFVLMHEFGHRWLQWVRVIESGQASQVLNPSSAHPAQYVDTRAAFRLYTDADSSVMGGATFADRGNGTFATPDDTFAWSYSWLDLYLMGLASPVEVPPFFYLTSVQPPLGNQYSPPARGTYSAKRRDVGIDGVTAALGLRSPAYPDTQRLFRVLFVLLDDPQRPATEADVKTITGYRTLFEQNFTIATGGRGAVTTAFTPVPPVKRRGAR